MRKHTDISRIIKDKVNVKWESYLATIQYFLQQTENLLETIKKLSYLN